MTTSAEDGRISVDAASTSDTRAPGSRGHDTIAVAITAAAAVALRLILLPRGAVINGDGVYYATLAHHLADGQVSDGISGYWSPLYPALVALASLVVSNLETAGRLVSVFAGGAVVVPTFVLARQLFDRRTALLAAGVVAVHPALLESSTWVMTEAVYTLLLMSAIAMGWTALRSGHWAWFAATGAVFGLAYLTRPEAIGFAPLFALFGVALGTRIGADAGLRTRAARAVLALAACAAVALPYVIVVHAKTGSWTISSKVDSNTQFGESGSILSLVDGGRTTRMDELFGSAFDVPAASPVVSDSAVAPPPQSPRPTRSHETGLRRLVTTGRDNLVHQVREYLPVVLPYALLACAALGLIAALATQGWPRHVYLLAFGVASVVGYSATVTELRYIYPLVPIAAAYLAFGAWTIAEGAAWLATRWRAGTVRSPLVVAGAAVTTLTLLGVALAPRYEGHFGRPTLEESPLEEKEAGRWLQQHTDDRDLLVMADNATVAFYAGGAHVFIPDEPFATVLDYARRRQVDYWVLSKRRMPRTSYARPSAATMSGAGLQLVYDEAPATDYGVQIFLVPR